MPIIPENRDSDFELQSASCLLSTLLAIEYPSMLLDADNDWEQL